MRLLTNIWYHNHPLGYVLQPLSIVYRGILALKKLSYKIKLKKITQIDVPVIIIGNLTVGGTGKTPLLIALANFLSQHGYKPGVVSRGYGRQSSQSPLLVHPHSNPAQAGDEPVLIARHTRCPVVVDANRVRAAQTLLNTQQCNLILSDDGLQHTALGRDIEIVVIDGARRFGNHHCLPAGPLREPLQRLQSVDFIVTRGAAQQGEWAMHFTPGKLTNLALPQKIFTTDLSSHTVHAIAGIGNPAAFFAQLRDMGFTIREHAFPDHYVYKPQDIDFGTQTSVIMTEKDAVKCAEFADERHWYLPVSADCGSMPDALLTQLKILKSRRNCHAKIT